MTPAQREEYGDRIARARAESDRATEVADFLNARDRTSAVPVTVRIGRTTYVEASYGQTRDVTPGCRAYEDGQRTYVQGGYYLLGALPASFLRKRSTVYSASSVMGAFYVACWFGQDEEEPNKWHPFGRMFQLLRDVDDLLAGQPTYDVRPMIVRAV